MRKNALWPLFLLLFPLTLFFTTFASAALIHTVTLSTVDGDGVSVNDGLITGPTQVVHHGNPSYTVTADAGFMLTAVSVDGTPLVEEFCFDEGDCLTTYTLTLTNVTADQTIEATFEAAPATSAGTTYTIDASSGEGGSLSAEGSAVVVPEGSSKTFTAIADLGYQLTELLVDGSPVEECLIDEPNDCWVPTQYTFTNVTDNSHSIVANFVLVYLPNPVMLESDQINYTSIQTAYNSIPDEGSDTIKVKAGEQTGYFVFNRDVTARIEGGYDSTLSNVVSYTNLYGTITISAGTVIVSNLIY